MRWSIAVNLVRYDLTGGDGAEVIIECSGNAHACAAV
jgi:threonine dehydrogenase-like Zn-dependent dehydrogenase